MIILIPLWIYPQSYIFIGISLSLSDATRLFSGFFTAYL
jgi:hypothetical protein